MLGVGTVCTKGSGGATYAGPAATPTSRLAGSRGTGEVSAGEPGSSIFDYGSARWAGDSRLGSGGASVARACSTVGLVSSNNRGLDLGLVEQLPLVDPEDGGEGFEHLGVVGRDLSLSQARTVAVERPTNSASLA